MKSNEMSSTNSHCSKKPLKRSSDLSNETVSLYDTAEKGIFDYAEMSIIEKNQITTNRDNTEYSVLNAENITIDIKNDTSSFISNPDPSFIKALGMVSSKEKQKGSIQSVDVHSQKGNLKYINRSGGDDDMFTYDEVSERTFISPHRVEMESMCRDVIVIEQLRDDGHLQSCLETCISWMDKCSSDAELLNTLYTDSHRDDNHMLCAAQFTEGHLVYLARVLHCFIVCLVQQSKLPLAREALILLWSVIEGHGDRENPLLVSEDDICPAEIKDIIRGSQSTGDIKSSITKSTPLSRYGRYSNPQETKLSIYNANCVEHIDCYYHPINEIRCIGKGIYGNYTANPEARVNAALPGLIVDPSLITLTKRDAELSNRLLPATRPNCPSSGNGRDFSINFREITSWRARYHQLAAEYHLASRETEEALAHFSTAQRLLCVLHGPNVYHNRCLTVLLSRCDIMMQNVFRGKNRKIRGKENGVSIIADIYSLRDVEEMLLYAEGCMKEKEILCGTFTIIELWGKCRRLQAVLHEHRGKPSLSLGLLIEVIKKMEEIVTNQDTLKSNTLESDARNNSLSVKESINTLENSKACGKSQRIVNHDNGIASSELQHNTNINHSDRAGDSETGIFTQHNASQEQYLITSAQRNMLRRKREFTVELALCHLQCSELLTCSSEEGRQGFEASLKHFHRAYQLLEVCVTYHSVVGLGALPTPAMDTFYTLLVRTQLRLVWLFVKRVLYNGLVEHFTLRGDSHIWGSDRVSLPGMGEWSPTSEESHTTILSPYILSCEGLSAKECIKRALIIPTKLYLALIGKYSGCVEDVNERAPLLIDVLEVYGDILMLCGASADASLCYGEAYFLATTTLFAPDHETSVLLQMKAVRTSLLEMEDDIEEKIMPEGVTSYLMGKTSLMHSSFISSKSLSFKGRSNKDGVQNGRSIMTNVHSYCRNVIPKMAIQKYFFSLSNVENAKDKNIGLHYRFNPSAILRDLGDVMQRQNKHYNISCSPSVPIVLLHHLLGRTLTLCERASEAYKSFDAALGLLTTGNVNINVIERDNMESTKASIFSSLAFSYFIEGKFENALRYTIDALHCRLKQFGHINTNVAASYGNIAVLYALLGNYHEAIDAANKCMTTVKGMVTSFLKTNNMLDSLKDHQLNDLFASHPYYRSVAAIRAICLRSKFS